MAQTQIAPAQSAATPRAGGKGLVYALIFGLILLPASFYLGPLRLSPLRLALLLAFVPFMFQILAGRAGRLTLVDGLMLLYTLWITISLLAVHGTSEISFAGITTVELLGGYMAGRLLVRSADDHAQFFRVYLWVLILLVPLALYELFTSHAVIIEALGGMASFDKNSAYRFGLSRVQVAFPHAILWGLFCAMAIGNLFYIYSGRLASALVRGGFALAMAYTSLSSGPFLAGILQIGLVLWDKIMRGSWKLLAVLSAIGYVVIDALSNRTPMLIFVETFTFSSGTAWYRIHIWRYGTDEVWRHPVFGIGLGDWIRPAWLSGSVDNFWLLNAMRYGLPGITFLIGAIAVSVILILRAKNLNPRTKQMRTGYLVTMAGVFFTLATVHVWEQMVVLVMFYIGLGSWFYTSAAAQAPEGPSDPDPAAAPEGPARPQRYSRPPRAKPAPQEARPAKPGPRYTRPKGSRPTYSRERE